MNRQWGAILLVAGTCLGSGMVALPIVLSKLGLYLGIAAMVFMWAVMYGAALVTVELNLQTKRSLPLGQLGDHFSGPKAKLLGILSLKLLSYALLAAFLYGVSSIVHELLPHYTHTTILLWCGGIAFTILSTHMPVIDLLNRFLFNILLVGLGGLILFLWIQLPGGQLPIMPSTCAAWSWAGILPVIFTAFGFHGMIHALTDYCQNDARVLKRAFFWGSLIPAVIYILWTVGVLGTIHGADPAFYHTMATKGVEVGDLVRELTELSHTPWLKTMIWAGMVLKFTLSIMGVGLSLREALKPLKPFQNRSQTTLSALCVFPPLLVAYLIPNAFIAVLGFAGMILVIIALFLPLYLLQTVKKPLTFPVLNNRWILMGLWIVGGLTVCAEIIHGFLK
jgi:tyrosine-specific transport protein